MATDPTPGPAEELSCADRVSGGREARSRLTERVCELGDVVKLLMKAASADQGGVNVLRQYSEVPTSE